MDNNYLASALDLLLQLPQSDKPVRFRVKGNSMAPFILSGDTVLVQAVTINQVSVGDILLVRIDEELFTHRLISKSNNKWITKGDGRLLHDPPIYHNDIIGRVVMIEHGNTHIDMQTRFWKFANLILGGLHRSGSSLVSFLRRLKDSPLGVV